MKKFILGFALALAIPCQASYDSATDLVYEQSHNIIMAYSELMKALEIQGVKINNKEALVHVHQATKFWNAALEDDKKIVKKLAEEKAFWKKTAEDLSK